ncbi:hypothetical protein GQ41_1526 [Arenibacter algicola]|uniref:Uncharacterized protein n=1 Tax=Arenibacter algicola TaxID=616991 RepID=A0ABY3A9F5_9FLAO
MIKNYLLMVNGFVMCEVRMLGRVEDCFSWISLLQVRVTFFIFKEPF